MEQTKPSRLEDFSKGQEKPKTSSKLRVTSPNMIENTPYFLSIKKANNDLSTQYDQVTSCQFLLVNI